jgi:N-acetylneuraminic acid mutarotase
MQFYSIENNIWTTSTPLPRAMNHINAAVVDGRIYVLGGLADLNEPAPAWRAVNDSFVYTPSIGLWETLPEMRPSVARGSAAVGVYGSMIVLAGGMTDLELSGARAQNSVDDVSIFDTQKKRWLDLPRWARRLPEARDHAGGAVVSGKMYVLGGRNQGQENVKDTVFVLDLEDLGAGWKISRSRMPTPRGGVAAGVVGGKVYVFGGEGNKEMESGVFDQVEAYDTVRECWEDAGRMRLPRHGTYAVGIGKRVYVPGGGILQSAGLVADFDVFEP